MSPLVRSLRQGTRLVRVLALAAVLSMVAPLVAVGVGEAGWELRRWHTEQGLPDPHVTALVQSADGFLWVGTAGGLARFDGVGFRMAAADACPALAAEPVSALLEDRRARLWVAMASGMLACGERGVFRQVGRIETAAGEAGLVRDEEGRTLPMTARRPVMLAEDGAGAVWALSELGKLCRVTPAGMEEAPLAVLPGEPTPEALWADDQGRIMVLCGPGVFRCEGSRWLPAGATGIDWTTTAPLVAGGGAGGVWMAFPPLPGKGGERLVKCFNGRQWSRVCQPTPRMGDSMREQVTALAGEPSGRAWIGLLWNGLWFADPGQPWRQVAGDEALAQCMITCLATDRHGSLWVGTDREGLQRLRRHPVATVGLPGDARGHIITSTCVTGDGALWLGTDGAGALRYAPDGGCEEFGEAEGLTARHVCSVFEDGGGRLWIGTWGGLFQCVGGRCEKVVGPPELNGAVLALFQDRRGRLWAGTQNGVVCRENETWRVVALAHGAGPLDVRAFAEDSKGNVWVGAIGGGLFGVDGGGVTRFGAADGFPSRGVRALFASPDHDEVWIGTMHHGLARFAAGGFTFWNRADGLPCESVGTLLADGAGKLWMGTNNGIFGCQLDELRLHPGGGSHTLGGIHLTQADGLRNRACSGSGQPVACRSADGWLWFPNYRVLAGFDPARVAAPRHPPSAALVEMVRVDGIPWSGSGGLRASTRDKRFEFVFTAPDLVSPHLLRFRHRLEGIDDAWVDAAGLRVASYSKLPAGEYRFQLMAGTGDHWREARPVVLRIVPQWWERAWVRVLGASLLAAAAAAALLLMQRRKHARGLARLQQARALEQERQRIAANIHDDLGASLTRITLLSDLVRDQADTAGIGAELQQIRDTSCDLTRAMDEVVWAIDPEHDSLESLLSYLATLAQDLLRAAGVSCRLGFPADLPDTALGGPVRHGLLLAVKEALHNVLKHAAASEVVVRAALDGGHLVLSVADNGRGFDPAATPAANHRPGGRGLVSMAARMSEIGGRCDIRSAPGGVTEVRLSIPLGQGS